MMLSIGYSSAYIPKEDDIVHFTDGTDRIGKVGPVGKTRTSVFIDLDKKKTSEVTMENDKLEFSRIQELPAWFKVDCDPFHCGKPGKRIKKGDLFNKNTIYKATKYLDDDFWVTWEEDGKAKNDKFHSSHLGKISEITTHEPEYQEWRDPRVEKGSEKSSTGPVAAPAGGDRRRRRLYAINYDIWDLEEAHRRWKFRVKYTTSINPNDSALKESTHMESHYRRLLDEALEERHELLPATARYTPSTWPCQMDAWDRYVAGLPDATTLRSNVGGSTGYRQ